MTPGQPPGREQSPGKEAQQSASCPELCLLMCGDITVTVDTEYLVTWKQGGGGEGGGGGQGELGTEGKVRGGQGVAGNIPFFTVSAQVCASTGPWPGLCARGRSRTGRKGQQLYSLSESKA